MCMLASLGSVGARPWRLCQPLAENGEILRTLRVVSDELPPVNGDVGAYLLLKYPQPRIQFLLCAVLSAVGVMLHLRRRNNEEIRAVSVFHSGGLRRNRAVLRCEAVVVPEPFLSGVGLAGVK